MPMKAPPAAPAPVYTWTGWYAGVNAGARSERSIPAGFLIPLFSALRSLLSRTSVNLKHWLGGGLRHGGQAVNSRLDLQDRVLLHGPWHAQHHWRRFFILHRVRIYSVRRTAHHAQPFHRRHPSPRG